MGKRGDYGGGERRGRRESSREAALGVLWLLIAVALGLCAWGVRGLWRAPVGGAAVEHTITAECVSAEDMAREYGWFDGDGYRDWREYQYLIQQANGWGGRWPLLRAGDRISVPDYRERKELIRR